MAQVKNKQLQQLLLQARFSPQEKRLQQIRNCETLIAKLQTDIAYPFDFICFHITGFRPRSDFNINSQDLISCETLLSDIPVYAAQLSREMKLPSSQITHKIYTTESLTSHFRVCQKTITRWRKKGLVGQYLKFPDGRLRLAFSAEMVEIFIANNRQNVQKSGDFSQISPGEREKIVQRLLKWSVKSPHLRQEAIRRTAKKYNRAIESVRQILVAEEKKRNSPFTFVRREDLMPDDKMEEIAKLYQRGVTVPDLMKQYGRSKSNIYHVINKAQAVELLKQDIEYIYNKDFDKPKVRHYYLAGENLQAGHLNSHKKDKQQARNALSQRDKGPLSDYIRDICRTELLSGREEKFLFGKYNYLKHLARQTQLDCDPDYPSARLLSKMRLYLRLADEVKDLLIRSNLRLVVSISKRHTKNDHEMAELISDGNMSLMNAIEKFDFGRNVKFSTYATWAIVKRYATYHSKQAKQPEHEACDEFLEVAHDMRIQDNRIPAIESARRSLDEVIRDTLEDREQTIVKEHYGLIRQTEITGQRKVKSLAQIADIIGLSKERVRQIELVALKKLRLALNPDQFDFLIKS